MFNYYYIIVSSLIKRFCIMMGYESKENQEKLFYYGFHLEQRVRPDHP